MFVREILLFAICLLGACGSSWRDSSPVQARAIASTSEPENPCVEAVERSVQRIFSGQTPRLSGHWRFAWQHPYPPAELVPRDLLVTEDGFFSKTHTQGFTRTYSARYPFALSHNDDRAGALFMIGRDPDGGFSLASIEPLRTPHPSGIHVLGRYLGVVDDERLVWFDAEQNRRVASLSLPAPALNRAGGGLGLARLADGSTLVLVAHPGNFAPGPRKNSFYLLQGDLTAPRAMEFLGSETYREPPDFRGDHRYSENVSLLRECGTGALYAAHTTGSDRLYGFGSLRLSRLDLSQRPARSIVRGVYFMRQHPNDCHFRSAATLFARPDHGLELWCHERAVHAGAGFFARENARFSVFQPR
jgi:hypothetical protein